MFEISAEINFTASHYLRLPEGKVEPPHQHDWRLQARLSAERLDAFGLVMDFYQLQRLLRQIVRPLVRAESVNDLADLAPLNPSTEVLARYLFERLAPLLPDHVRLEKVTLWETSDCSGSFGQGKN